MVNACLLDFSFSGYAYKLTYHITYLQDAVWELGAWLDNGVAFLLLWSGCAAPSRPWVGDMSKEDHHFKNSWSAHDSIVTCSRDGSAIIWTPRTRKYHVSLMWCFAMGVFRAPVGALKFPGFPGFHLQLYSCFLIYQLVLPVLPKDANNWQLGCGLVKSVYLVVTKWFLFCTGQGGKVAKSLSLASTATTNATTATPGEWASSPCPSHPTWG